MGDEVLQENQENVLENETFLEDFETDTSITENDNTINTFPQNGIIIEGNEVENLVNENTVTEQIVDYNGQVISLNEAIYRENIKTNFYLSLILIVTVVFFIINKFWSWCRRLFTVQV